MIAVRLRSICFFFDRLRKQVGHLLLTERLRQR
jgi:hypothetical protein